MAEEEPSYIDYEAFLDPSFSAVTFANKLVLATSDPTETPLDLSTPLSRVLFDVQEIDTHIDALTTKSALPLLDYTKSRADASKRILDDVESQVVSLTEAYKTLQKEVGERYEAAEQVRLVADRLCQTVRLGRSVGRGLLLGRQLEVQMSEFAGSTAGRKGDHRAMVRSANTLASLKDLLSASNSGEEGHGLDRVSVISSLKSDLMAPAEKMLISKAQQTVREFSMSLLVASTLSNQPAGSGPTFTQNEETKSRTTSALLVLYLLSPLDSTTKLPAEEPKLLVAVLEEYLQTSLKSSLASLARSLATLPSLDRTLLEISARCQNIVALESLLEYTKPPQHPVIENRSNVEEAGVHSPPNFLQPLLQSLDTSSLPSFFWRTLASALSPRVQEIMNRGGVSARTLRTNKEKVRDGIRQCVDRGSQLPGSSFGRGKASVSATMWEREAAVMVGAVLGVLGR
jgi:hypothetical protein